MEHASSGFLHDNLNNDNREEYKVPDDVLRDFARFLLPHILEMYRSEEGKKQLEAWNTEQENEKEEH